MELAPGVYALPLTFEYGETELTIHPVAIETHRGAILIDVGPPGGLDRLESRLDDVDLAVEDVWAVLVTHHDGDHAGGLRDLLERVDATVFAHREAAPFVRGDRDPLKGDGDRYPPAPVDVELVDGVTVPAVAGDVEVVATPGHAPGHVSLYLPDERLLLAADALTADNEEGRLEGPKPDFTPDMETAMESVERLADLAVDNVLCYHGGTVAAGDERIREIAESG